MSRINENQKDVQTPNILQKKKSTGISHHAISPFGGKSLGEIYGGSHPAVPVFKNKDNSLVQKKSKVSDDKGLEREADVMGVKALKNLAQRKSLAKDSPDKKELTEVTVFRKDIDLGAEDKYGHWWTKITPTESYGWWPKEPVGMKKTLFGTEGELNGVTNFGGAATSDPHHSDTTGDEYKVISESSKSETQIQDEMRNFATSYSGKWRWTFGFGQNCHTFQKDMLKKSNLKIEKK